MRTRRTLVALLGATPILLLSGCGQEPAPTSPDAVIPVAEAAPASAIQGSLAGAAESDLAALRRLTARFHDFDEAVAAGWEVQVTECRSNPPVGAMGYHFANPAFIDAEVAVLEPEILVFEPRKNGELRLVGVEYIVPFTELDAQSTPPMLFGQSFLPNAGDQVWMLHVWLWRNNPDGIFATWNPQVSCAHADP